MRKFVFPETGFYHPKRYEALGGWLGLEQKITVPFKVKLLSFKSRSLQPILGYFQLVWLGLVTLWIALALSHFPSSTILENFTRNKFRIARKKYFLFRQIRVLQNWFLEGKVTKGKKLEKGAKLEKGTKLE